jgi:hypothetical protein
VQTDYPPADFLLLQVKTLSSCALHVTISKFHFVSYHQVRACDKAALNSGYPRSSCIILAKTLIRSDEYNLKEATTQSYASTLHSKNQYTTGYQWGQKQVWNNGGSTACPEALCSRMQDHKLRQFRPKFVPVVETAGKLRPESGLPLADSTQDGRCCQWI